jgi:hypothetical protein
MNHYPKTRIDPNIVIDVFNTMKREPLKVYGKCDFSHCGLTLERSFYLLKRLNIIEEVPYICMKGKDRRIRTDIKGYRLL